MDMIKFKIPMESPYGNVKQAVVFTSLKFSREIWPENINLRITSISIIFKGTRLDEST